MFSEHYILIKPRPKSTKWIGTLLLFFLFLQTVYNQSNQYFENPSIFTENDGLNVGIIKSVVADKNGFLWVAGEEGLQRFDGYFFKDYFRTKEDSSSLMGQNIRKLYYDESKDQIWISNWNEGGISILDLSTETLKNFPFDHSQSNGLTDNEIFWTCKDKYGNFWSSVFNKGLVKFLPDTETFQSITYNPRAKESTLDYISLNTFQSYTLDISNDSILWLGSNAGLLKFNVLSNKFKRYPIPYHIRSGLSIRTLLSLAPDKLFFGTWGQGIFKFNPQTGIFTKCNLNGHSVYGARTSIIQNIKTKSDSTLWVTTVGGLATYNILTDKIEDSKLNDLLRNKLFGTLYTDNIDREIIFRGRSLYIFNPKNQQIKPFRYPVNKEYVFNGVIKIIEEPNTQKLWIVAGHSEGLYQFNLQNEEWKVFLPPKSYFINNPNFDSWDGLISQNGELLILTSDAIYRFDKKTNSLILWDKQPEFTTKRLRRMIEGENGNIWVGSHHDGLYKYNPTTNKTTHYKEALTGPEKQSPGSIWDIKEDKKGNIWVRGRGYSVYDIERDTFYNFPYFYRDEKTVYHINSLGIDGEGNVWVASHDGSVGITDSNHPEAGINEYFDLSNGLKSKKPGYFALDQNNNVWITSEALEKVNPDRMNTDYFKPQNLLNEYINVALPMSDGRIAVGFSKGIGIFHPDSLRTNTYLPKPYVRNFQVFDKKIKTELPLYKTKEIHLKPNQNFFSIEISALDTSYSGEVGFLYQLEGVNPDWVDPKGRDYIAYTNVGSGSYKFKVKARNGNGIWNENIFELMIHIGTPWFKTTWAYLLSILSIIFIAVSLYRFQISRKIAQQESIRLQELNEFKTRFFTNITHEFRTPLTVINGMTEELINHPTKQPIIALGLIKKNSKKLLKLINQILDLSKSQAGILTTNIKQDDIVAFIRYLTESHQSLAMIKDIKLTFSTEEESLLMDFDADKIEKIMTNLISNAIKFTQESGRVQVIVQERNPSNSSSINILIKDNGIGISEKDLPFVFDRFYQIQNDRSDLGTGIGLAFVKEIVNVIGGKIKVDSKENKGSTFTLILPVHLKNSKVYNFEMLDNDKTQISLSSNNLGSEERHNSNELPILLIIEDNEDVLYYLNSCLEGQYHILVANNGHDGIERAIFTIPDIIISDVMMPIKDGFEVCNTLKEDERTSHIPIILLTAKSTSDDKLTGLKQGADAYLIKPFDKVELLVRLENLRAIRETLQLKYSRTLANLNPEVQISKTKEDVFLEKAEKIINENIDDESFSHEILAKAMALSRSQLHRKLKAISGNSTSIYIRLVRLEKAKELLKSDELTISEIAYQTGFKSPVYFSQIFKKTFGKSPSDSRDLEARK